jgi:hypothetical protein
MYDLLEGVKTPIGQNGIGGDTRLCNPNPPVVKYLWLLKATGLGVTEFFLRYICYLGVCCNERVRGRKFFIVCGPREEIAIELIKRLKDILSSLEVVEETQKTVCDFLGVHVETFPSHHVATMRAFTDVSFILVDEADFFAAYQQKEMLDATERYIGKSDTNIVMVSTPNLPGGLFDRMENDNNPDFLYHRLKLPYTVGENKIYSKKDIENARKSASFEREYNLKYGFGTGNLFLPQQIENMIVEPERFEGWVLEASEVSIGVDPGFGSSAFAYCVCALIDNSIHVIESDKFDRADFNIMVDNIFRLYVKYKARKIWVDAANPAFIVQLKVAIGERTNIEQILREEARDHIDPFIRFGVVCPIPFNKYSRPMITNLIHIVSEGSLHIPNTQQKLITEIRVAKTKENSALDKESNSMDLVDALRLSCFMYDYVGQN